MTATEETMQFPDKLYYRPDELAKAADLSVWTIYRLMKENKIIHSHIGRSVRIPKDEFLRILSEGAPKAEFIQPAKG